MGKLGGISSRVSNRAGPNSRERSRLQSAAMRYGLTILQSLLPIPPEPIPLRQSVVIRHCRSLRSSGHERF